MTNPTNPNAAGCVLCLLQLSDSMRPLAWNLPWRKQKLAALRRLLDHVLAELIALQGLRTEDEPPIEVGVVGYRTGPAGTPLFIPLLPGATVERVLIPVTRLDARGADPESNGTLGMLETEVSGAAPLCAAFEYARRVLQPWIESHPHAPAPVVILGTDGEADDPPIGPAGRALTGLHAAGGPVLLCSCVFRKHVHSALFPETPEDPWRDLWEVSSPVPSGGELGHSGGRAIALNYFAPSTIVRLIRAHWEATAATPAPMNSADAIPATVPAECARADEPTTLPAPAAATPTEPRFEARNLWMPKRGNTESEWEDAFQYDPARGIVAVCDGASDGIFSKLWADILSRSFVADPIDLDEPDAVNAWIQERRRDWSSKINYSALRWSIQMRVDRSCGAATFLAFRLLDDRADGASAWKAWAVGDICLFHTRENQLLFSFPVANANDFGTTPPLYRSKPMGSTPGSIATEGACRPGDLFLFATDALAQRLLLSVEEGNAPDWERYWTLDPAEWRQQIETLRDDNQIVNDDCTLLAVRIPGAPRAVSLAEGVENREGEAPAEPIQPTPEMIDSAGASPSRENGNDSAEAPVPAPEDIDSSALPPTEDLPREAEWSRDDAG